MSIPEHHKKNFDTLLTAASYDELCLMEATLKATGQTVAVICTAVNQGERGLAIVPFAMMFEGDPFELLEPPEGGALETAENRV